MCAEAGRNEKPVRCERATLQKALMEQVPDGAVRLKKKLVGFERTGTGTRVEFADGTVEEVDLLVGADGIRSVRRRHSRFRCPLNATRRC